MDVKSRSVVLLFVGILAVACGAAYALLTIMQHPKDTPAPAPESAIQQKVLLELPGATPITMSTDDTRQPTSPWVVVSNDHPLLEPQFVPTDLQLITSVATRTDKSEEERSLRHVAIPALEAMLTDAQAAGYELMVGSAFRSYALQNTYYTNYVRTSGEAVANTFSARPGRSEHQTGLAVDISLMSKQCYLETCFGQTSAGIWLASNATNYGFILRYPADKTHVTQYQYEPWHFRYVGVPLATALKQSSLTLDEAYPYIEATRLKLIEIQNAR